MVSARAVDAHRTEAAVAIDAAIRETHPSQPAQAPAVRESREASAVPPQDPPSSAQLSAGTRWQDATFSAASPHRRLFIASSPPIPLTIADGVALHVGDCCDAGRASVGIERHEPYVRAIRARFAQGSLLRVGSARAPLEVP